MLAQTLKVGCLSLALLLPGLASGRNLSQFLNPILPGFHPDPSCTFISEEGTFYCASSSFNAFPGVPIHASKDLSTWRLVGESLPRSTRLPFVAGCPCATTGAGAHQPQSELSSPIYFMYWQYHQANVRPVSGLPVFATCRSDHRFSARVLALAYRSAGVNSKNIPVIFLSLPNVSCSYPCSTAEAEPGFCFSQES